MVYQSVEAPQIEPLKEQEFQKDPDKPVFTSYDLVRGKSAGVLISINKAQNKKYNIFREFKLQMKIGGHQINTKCLNDWELFPIPAIFQSLRKPQKKQPDPSACFFAMDFLQDYNPSVSLFIELPMSGFLSIAKDDVPIKVDLVDVQSSEIISLVDFKVNVIETRPISIGLVGIKLKCKVNGKMEDLSTSQSTMKNFFNSEEVKNYLPSIFPIAEPKKLEDIIEPLRVKHFYKHLFPEEEPKVFNKLKAEEMLFVKGSCDKGSWFPFSWTETRGLDRVVFILQDVVKKSSKDKIMVIASKKHMNYHGVDTDKLGFVSSPPENWEERILRIFGKKAERKVGLIREVAINGGTLLHELGHTFGQLKEFYKGDSRCQRFNSSPDKKEPCID